MELGSLGTWELATSHVKKSHTTIGTKKSCNLLGPTKIMQPLWTKKSRILLGQKIMQPLRTKKRHTTSQDKKNAFFWDNKNCAVACDKKSGIPLEQKESMPPLWTKKILQPLWTKKITQPLGTKKSHNLFGQKNHVSSLVNCSLIMRNTVAFVCYNNMLY